VSVAKLWDELWQVVKSQSRLGIAGSPRNSFRASVRCFAQEVEHWIDLVGFVPPCLTKLRIPDAFESSSQSVGAKVHRQKGKNPDHRLRSLN
jgi:hypothetical protein